jgi:hypothetical protein
MALRLDKNQRRRDRSSDLGMSDQREVNRVAPGSPPAVLIAEPDNAPVRWRYVRDDELDLGLECLLITIERKQSCTGTALPPSSPGNSGDAPENNALNIRVSPGRRDTETT